MRIRPLSLVCGVVLLVGAPAAYLLTQPPTAVGDLRTLTDGGSAGPQPGPPQVGATVRAPYSAAPEEGASSPAPRSAPTQQQDATAPPRQSGSDDSLPSSISDLTPAPVATRSGFVADAQASPRPAPTRLRIPSIGVDASIVTVGVDSDGLMEIPEDVDTAGWYRFGAAPGEAGSAVIAGHVDSREQGLGIFARLRDVEPGALVEVATTTGVLRFQVNARQLIDKPEVPLDALFDREGTTRLTLVTCGGDFDGTRRSYRSNVIVTAVPV